MFDFDVVIVVVLAVVVAVAAAVVVVILIPQHDNLCILYNTQAVRKNKKNLTATGSDSSESFSSQG